MAELLTHVLVAYALFTAAGWYLEWLDARWVAVGMVGSILPDLNRLALFVPDDRMTDITGIAFDWGGLHTIGGALLLSAIGATLFARRRDQWRAFLVLFAGAVSHLIVDLPQRYADGNMLTNLYLYPVSSVRPPTPGWYVSADRWVAVVALAVAAIVFVVDRRRR